MSSIEISYSTVYFYAREKLWRTLQLFCLEEYKKFNDPFFIFWKAFGLFKENSVVEAINDLTTIQNRKEIQYAVIIALIYYHNLCKMFDKDSLDDLEFRKESSKKTANEKALITAGYFCMFTTELREATDLLDSCSETNQNVQIAKGWLEIYNNSESSIKNALVIYTNIFRENSQDSIKSLEALMGKAKASEMQKKFNITLDSLNEIIVQFPKFLPALDEKAKVLMMIGDWEQSMETVSRILTLSPSDLIAYKIQSFNTLAREGNIELSITHLSQLTSLIEQNEPKNTEFMLETAKLFSRICGCHPSILKFTLQLVQKCRKLNPILNEHTLELANHHVMLKDYNTAFGLFQESASLDESSLDSLVGMIKCRIYQGMIDDAEKQIEFVNEIQGGGERTPEIAFLEAILTARKPLDPSMTSKQANELRIVNSVKFIDESLKLHIQLTKSLIPGFEFYIKLDPYFLLSLAEEYLQFISFDNIVDNKESPGAFVIKGNKLLETITKQIPGLLPAHLLLAKGKLAVADTAASMKSVNKVVEMDPKNEEAYIIHAIISIKSGNPNVGLNFLQQGIANNFQIRNSPLFLLYKGQLEYEARDYTSALQTLEQAYDLPGIRDKSIKKGKKNEEAKVVVPVPTSSSFVLPFTERERCKIFVYLAKAYVSNKKINEAKTVISRAISEFTGTEQEVNVLIANSEIAILTGDLKKALSILKAVNSESAYFAEARKIMAEVYLTHLMDRRHFAKCYTDLIDVSPSFENYKLLGDALMRIQEPEDAISAYNEANRLNPKDESIIRDIGKALVATHNYNKAIEYYENSLRQFPDRADLKLDLGNLYLMINNFKKAQDFLTFELFSDDFQAPNNDTLKRNVQGFLSLYKLNLKKQGLNDLRPNDHAKRALEKSIQTQSDLIERCKIEGGFLEEERKFLGELFFELSKYLSTYEKDEVNSLSSLERAAKNSPDNEKITAAMADLYLRMGDKSNCEAKALSLLKINPNNAYASYILSEILLQNDEENKALGQFQKILDEHPDNFSILSKLIEFFKKTGKLDDAKVYIEKSEARTPNKNDPGLCYCRGIYSKYNRNPQEAIRELTKAKRSTLFKEDTIIHMIDLLLNPEQDLYFNNSDDTSALKSLDPENLRLAETLLKELQVKAGSPKVVVIEAYVSMFGRKNGAELATVKLGELLKSKPDYAPAMLALSVAKFLTKKATEAKNFLKILSKRPYSSEYADELEKAWLLYADSFIAISKFDNAEEMLRKCLKHNQSCGKAEEFIGLIKEKEQAFKDAADSYERAWKLTNKKSATIGFRLAFNYLKCRRFVECIDICKQVLELYPDYPKIDKEVLSKARMAIKNPTI